MVESHGAGVVSVTAIDSANVQRGLPIRHSLPRTSRSQAKGKVGAATLTILAQPLQTYPSSLPLLYIYNRNLIFYFCATLEVMDTPTQPEKIDVHVDRLQTLLVMLENSVGTRLFQNLYARIGDSFEAEDILYGGERSCAFYTSGILAIFGLIDRAHATVASVQRLLDEDPKWQRINIPQPGAVFFWKLAPDSAGELYRHCGFSVGNDKAISTSELSRVPVVHHETFGTIPNGTPKRAIEAIYQHELLVQLS
jgi:hypothetical protein